MIKFLVARGLDVSDEQKARILACADRETLDTWIRMAVTLTDTDDLFDV